MALGDHLPGAFGADHPGAAHIGFEQVVELLDRGGVPRHEGIDRRVRHDIVEPPALPRHFLHHRRDGLRIAHVGDHGEGIAACLLHLLQRLAGIDARLLAHRDQRALGGQAHCGRLADPGGGAGHESDLACKSPFQRILLVPVQKMAIGFHGEPVAPGRRKGSPTTMNSDRPSSRQATASSSSCRLSETHMPIAVSCSGWMG